MNKDFLLKKVSLIICVIIFSQCSNQKKALNVQDSMRETLESFYLTNYGEDTMGLSESMMNRFLSKELNDTINKLRSNDNLILDYDPFIEGQDFDYHTVKNTLIVKPLNQNGLFSANFKLFPNSNFWSKIKIQMKIDKDGKVVICSLPDNKLLNIPCH